MASSNRRIEMRVPAQFKVDFVHKGNYIISFNKDVSVDGMFLCTENPPAVGSHLTLRFAVGSIDEVEIPAIVVWARKAASAKNTGMGVQFLDAPPQNIKENIIQYVSRVAILEKGMGNA